MELLLGRIALPSTRPAFTGVVAQHEQGVLAEMRSVLASNKASHRSVSLASVILPRCIAIIEAIGHRMALEAATAAGTDPALIDIFTTNVISSDSAWYVEHGLTRAEQARMEREAVYAATPRLQEFVDGLRSDAFITAPIASDERWDAYMSSLPTFTSESLDTLPSIALKSMSPAAILEIPEIPLMPRL
jgi:acyl-CoA oxidase